MALESQRALHEDIERLEDAITSRYLHMPTTTKDQRAINHEIAAFLDQIQSQSTRLKSLYIDSDGTRAAEIQRTGTGDVFDSFYKSYNDLKDHHRRYPGAPVENLEKAYQRRPPTGDGTSVLEKVAKMFSGEEVMGKCFDLVEAHERYMNLPGVRTTRRLTYLQYIEFFDKFEQYPILKAQKLSNEYWAYVNGLAEYLEGFWKRTRPLEDLDKLMSTWDKEFDEDWANLKVSGWSKDGTDQVDGHTNNQDVEMKDSDDLYCTACEKPFANQNVYDAHLTGKKHRNNVARKSGPSVNSTPGLQSAKERAVAAREFRIRRLASAMQTERQDTKINIERRAGMTERERQQEIEQLLAEEIGDGENGEDSGNASSDEEDKIANPLNLPMSWDGKPIPFWLYKLHGLGNEYDCEICGGYVYAGRRAFEKHFSEQRHTFGLKCLGIQNSSLFREVTKIEDARALSERLQQNRKQETKRTKANVEEMEDAQGHVMPKTVFEDLKKQGLI